MSKTELEVAMIRKGVSVAILADAIGLDRSTLYRKMANGKFERSEIMKIRDMLELSDADIIRIFFEDDSCGNVTNQLSVETEKDET